MYVSAAAFRTRLPSAQEARGAREPRGRRASRFLSRSCPPTAPLPSPPPPGPYLQEVQGGGRGTLLWLPFWLETRNCPPLPPDTSGTLSRRGHIRSDSMPATEQAGDLRRPPPPFVGGRKPTQLLSFKAQVTGLARDGPAPRLPQARLPLAFPFLFLFPFFFSSFSFFILKKHTHTLCQGNRTYHINSPKVQITPLLPTFLLRELPQARVPDAVD